MSYATLLEDAEYFCSKSEESSGPASKAGERFSTASILFSFMAMESFINNMLFDFAAVPKDLFTVHEQGFLVEKSVTFSISGTNAGRFELSNKDEYKRLEEKIMFLLARFGGEHIDKGSTLWQRFEKAKEIRNRLSHPKKDVASLPTPSDARYTLEAAGDIIKLVSAKVWGKSVNL